MTDERLRTLERLYRESGAEADGRRYLHELERHGDEVREAELHEAEYEDEDY